MDVTMDIGIGCLRHLLHQYHECRISNGEPVPVINKIMASNQAVVTPIPSIFQAGQWTYSPSGVPMSILTGKLAARRILSF